MRYRPYRAAGKPQNPIIKNENLAARIEKVLNEEGHGLTANSVEFLTSIHDFAKKKGGLTEAQLRYFEKIESAFTPEAKKARESFVETLTEQDWKHWKIALAYYENMKSYHMATVEKAKDPNFVPTEKQFNQIVRNKYAQRVIEATEQPPKYENESLVTIRRGVRRPKLRKFVDTPCIVIESNHRPVTDSCKGAKPYLVLPFGHDGAIDVTEKEIKKTR